MGGCREQEPPERMLQLTGVTPAQRRPCLCCPQIWGNWGSRMCDLGAHCPLCPPREDGKAWGQPGGCSACQDPTNPEQVWNGNGTSARQSSLLPCPALAVQEGGAWPSPEAAGIAPRAPPWVWVLPVPDPEPCPGEAVMGWRFPIPAKLGCCSCHGNVGGLRAGAHSPPLWGVFRAGGAPQPPLGPWHLPTSQKCHQSPPPKADTPTHPSAKRPC